MTTSNLMESAVTDILRSVLGAAEDPVLAVDPSPGTVEALVSVASDPDGSFPEVNVLAEESVLKGVMEDFLVASEAADLVSGGELSFRTLGSSVENTLLLTRDSVVAVVAAADRVAGLGTDDDAFVEAAYDSYASAFEAAEEFSLRTPPISAVRGTLEEELGEAVRADFDAMLEAVEAVDDGGLDEVTISLLVAARNDVLLYDISKWGEDVGIASKATFSRTKTRLEDVDLIDTEKVPIDVGRPRLRLKLGPAADGDAEPDDVVATARAALA